MLSGKIKRCAMLALFWKLWFERKGRLFEGKSQDARNLWITLSFWDFLWTSTAKEFKEIPDSLILLSWKNVI